MKSARVKADQIRATNADIVCTACENCHTQLTDINEHYGLGKRVEFLSKLVADALLPRETAASTGAPAAAAAGSRVARVAAIT